MSRLLLVVLIIGFTACSDREEWTCKVHGKSMFSVSKSGKLGSADKGCSCAEIRSFERKTFGEVDEDALRSDFGC
jgi:hypothetical protein